MTSWTSYEHFAFVQFWLYVHLEIKRYPDPVQLEFSCLKPKMESQAQFVCFVQS